MTTTMKPGDAVQIIGGAFRGLVGVLAREHTWPDNPNDSQVWVDGDNGMRVTTDGSKIRSAPRCTLHDGAPIVSGTEYCSTWLEHGGAIKPPCRFE